MSWVALAAVAALCYALQGAWTKRLTRMVTRETATWAIFAFAVPALAAYLALDGLPSVEPIFWAVLAANSVLYVLSFRLYVSALEVGELGLTYPLLALTPVLVVPVEWLLLGDRAGLAAVGGILLVAGGVYLLYLEGDAASLLAPFRGLGERPGSRRMLGVALIWSVSGTLDRAAVHATSPALYGTLVSVVVGAALLPAAVRDLGPAGDASADGGGASAPAPGPGGGGTEGGARSERTDPAAAARKEAARARREDREGRALPVLLGALGLQGLLFAGMFAAQMEALRLSLAANVITVKRAGTLLTVLMGGLLFRERHLGRRLAGTAILLAGVWLVASS